MDEDGGSMSTHMQSAEDWLSRAEELLSNALQRARSVKIFAVRWKSIISKLEKIPPHLSNLSSHPCFTKNTLCKELLQSITSNLEETVQLADQCLEDAYTGKLQMQSDLDSLTAKLGLNLSDCGVLIRTGILGEATLPLSMAPNLGREGDSCNIREMLARLQIGHIEMRHHALGAILDIMNDDEQKVVALVGRNHISALMQLLVVPTSAIREKAVTVLCCLAESGNCEDMLISEGIIPPLIRLVESGSSSSKEKATVSLQRLSMSPDTARLIVGHSGIHPLIEITRTGDSVSQAAATGTLKNIAAVPEVRQNLAEEGAISAMINLLQSGVLLGTKEYAAECLQHLTASNDSLRRAVVSQGGIKTLLSYIDGPLPQESAVAALRNLVGTIPTSELLSLGLLPRLLHVLQSGSSGAQQAATSALCKICCSAEVKKLVGETGCIPLLVDMLEVKTNSGREVAAQAICSLLSVPQNCKEVKRNEKSVPNLVQLLDPCPHNTAKKYAISCLLYLCSSRKCRKVMISYGTVGYLKKLGEMDVPGAKKLLERLERGRLRSLFSRKHM